MKTTLFIKIILSVWLGFIFLATSVHGEQNKPETMTISLVNFNLFPWYFMDNTGIMIDALRIIEKKLDIEIKFQHFPFLRAMSMLEKGLVDGFAPLTFKEYRLQFANFPTGVTGKIDIRKAIIFEGYSIYKLKKSNLGFNGYMFTNLTGNIGTQPGFAVIENLKNLGLENHLDSGARGQENNLKKIIHNRIQAAALLRTSADYILKTNPVFGTQIERIPIPITYEGLYLVLSHDFITKYPKFSQKIWQTVEEVRNSKEFRELFDKFGVECHFCPSF